MRDGRPAKNFPSNGRSRVTSVFSTGISQAIRYEERDRRAKETITADCFFRLSSRRRRRTDLRPAEPRTRRERSTHHSRRPCGKTHAFLCQRIFLDSALDPVGPRGPFSTDPKRPPQGAPRHHHEYRSFSPAGGDCAPPRRPLVLAPFEPSSLVGEWFREGGQNRKR